MERIRLGFGTIIDVKLVPGMPLSESYALICRKIPTVVSTPLFGRLFPALRKADHLVCTGEVSPYRDLYTSFLVLVAISVWQSAYQVFRKMSPYSQLWRRHPRGAIVVRSAHARGSGIL